MTATEFSVDVQVAPPTELPDCPYRGLDPFTEHDREYFFGREEDTMTIGANLLTAPVTVLYGASGVGKSSVLMAGVMPFLRTQGNTTVVLFRSWQNPDLIPALNRAVADAVRLKTDEPVEESKGFDVCVASAVAATNGPIAIIFDQFEEFLLYHGLQTESGAAFDRQFARLANRDDAPVNFLLSIREDCAANLDRFQRRIPHLLTNFLRLEQLDIEGARRATIKPLERYNEVLREHDHDAAPFEIEPALVENVLKEVRTGTVKRAGDGTGLIGRIADGAERIETPFMQMILRALWKEELSRGSKTLRLGTLDELGGAERIVQSYVDDVVQRLPIELQEVCARMFDRLVTPSGMKIAYTHADLEKMVGQDCRGVFEALSALTGEKRILREVESLTDEPRYEIFHDVLAMPILEWRTRYQTDKRERDRSLAARRRTRAVVGGVVVLLAALGISQYFTYVRRANRGVVKTLVADAEKFIAQERPKAAAMNALEARKLFSTLKDEGGPSTIEGISAKLVEAAGRFEDPRADAFYEAGIETTLEDRRRLRALILLTRARLSRGDTKAARESLERATAVKADALRFRLQIGQAWLELGEHDQALKILEEVRTKSEEKKDPGVAAEVRYSLGMAYHGKKAHKQAEEVLIEAVRAFEERKRQDDVARTLAALAAVYRDLGKHSKAELTREAAIAAWFQTSDAAGILGSLEKRAP